MNLTESMEPIISFIIPVYNASNFLEKCFQSIANQTLENIEVIVVDDGSTDSSLDLCSQFASRHKNFKVFSKKNEGGAIARNYGFEKSSGTFICYVDPDDWIEPSMCEDVVQLLSETNADFANFGIDFISSSGKVIKKIHHFEVSELLGHEILKNSLIDTFILSTPNNKIYRRSFLLNNKIQFPPIRAFEDLPYTRAVSYYANKAVFISKVYYHALVREGSLTREMSLKYVDIAREALILERGILFKDEFSRALKLSYKAHVVKLFSSLLIRSAFRISSYSEYKKCFKVAEACGYYIYSRNSNVIHLLGPTYYLFAFLCRNPLLLRFIAKIAKFSRYELY